MICRSLFVVGAALVVACASGSSHESEAVGLGADVALPERIGSVIVDGCVLDPWQRATLASAGARRVLRGGDVIFLCLVPRLDGTLGPRDPSALAALSALATDLRGEGYRVHFAISFTDETGQRYDGTQTRVFLTDPAWRRRLIDSSAGVIVAANGVELDLQQLPNDARPYVTELVRDLAAALRPVHDLGIFVPPSVTTPSDLPGGEAFALSEIAPFVDHVRVMTLDYSDVAPGPTIDPGWAVDAARHALYATGRVDVAYPLYGTDFGPGGHRSISYLEGRAIPVVNEAPIEHGPTGAPFVRYAAIDGPHELWFDDATSTGRALGAWTFDVLPAGVGVVFYGLGAEDPALFDRLAARMP